MLKVTNPSDFILRMQYKGSEYVLEPGESSVLEPEVASHWKHKVHGFVVLDATDMEQPAPVKEEEVKEVDEKPAPEEKEVVAEEEAVKPKKKASKKK